MHININTHVHTHIIHTNHHTDINAGQAALVVRMPTRQHCFGGAPRAVAVKQWEPPWGAQQLCMCFDQGASSRHVLRMHGRQPD